MILIEKNLTEKVLDFMNTNLGQKRKEIAELTDFLHGDYFLSLPKIARVEFYEYENNLIKATEILALLKNRIKGMEKESRNEPDWDR